MSQGCGSWAEIPGEPRGSRASPGVKPGLQRVSEAGDRRVVMAEGDAGAQAGLEQQSSSGEKSVPVPHSLTLAHAVWVGSTGTRVPVLPDVMNLVQFLSPELLVSGEQPWPCPL